MTTLSSRIFRSYETSMDAFELPFECTPYTLTMAWHPR
jgi:hypothetical protein